MYKKIISISLIGSLIWVPIASAAETPFYLKDKSPLPLQNTKVISEVYHPGTIAYADWLIKRANAVSIKLAECYEDLEKNKDLHNSKEKAEHDWILIKIKKKTEYLNFLNEKFKLAVGAKMSDSGYLFSINPNQKRDLAKTDLTPNSLKKEVIVALVNKTEVMDQALQDSLTVEVDKKPLDTESLKNDIADKKEEPSKKTLKKNKFITVKPKSKNKKVQEKSLIFSSMEPETTKNDLKQKSPNSLVMDKNEALNIAPTSLIDPEQNKKASSLLISNESSIDTKITLPLTSTVKSEKNPEPILKNKVELDPTKITSTSVPPSPISNGLTDVPSVEVSPTPSSAPSSQPTSSPSPMTSVKIETISLVPSTMVSSPKPEMNVASTVPHPQSTSVDHPEPVISPSSLPDQVDLTVSPKSFIPPTAPMIPDMHESDSKDEKDMSFKNDLIDEKKKFNDLMNIKNKVNNRTKFEAKEESKVKTVEEEKRTFFKSEPTPKSNKIMEDSPIEEANGPSF